MTALAWLIPCALLLGLLGLAAFLWSLNSGQFEDLEGAAWRALQDDEQDRSSIAVGLLANEVAKGMPDGASDQRERQFHEQLEMPCARKPAIRPLTSPSALVGDIGKGLPG